MLSAFKIKMRKVAMGIYPMQCALNKNVTLRGTVAFSEDKSAVGIYKDCKWLLQPLDQ